jgi:hypothetical protein
MLGGSLGKALVEHAQTGKPIDPHAQIRDLDLIFKSMDDAQVFIAKKLMTYGGASCEYKGHDPYPHWLASYNGVPVCLYMNKDATRGGYIHGIVLQNPEEIVACRKRIRSRGGNSSNRRRNRNAM